MAVAVILVAGPWWLTLYRGFGSPLFPYFNGLFRSPFAAPVNFNDARFLPRTVAQALFYPLYWAIRPQTLVIELPTRDPRFLLAYVSLADDRDTGIGSSLAAGPGERISRHLLRELLRDLGGAVLDPALLGAA